MNDTIYHDLADWLITTSRAPHGVKSPELMDILRFQCLPEEAQLALDIGPEGGKIDALTKKRGMTRDERMPVIKSMEKKGTIYTEAGRSKP
jgi:hypothetical protein